ncbi:MAG: hypothetical protein EGP06_06320 [SAR202 cluster bacterium]|jgi:hypothetical protein|nr:MAG: hypothetical protein EGP06_06320 [SAR202 cluster bacterium]|tara:strand:- start:1180 stop:1374 length:195 start_codon:yes stop_codon:yes gene_type:complete
MNKKKTLSSIMAESYSVYFEFIGIILSWLLIAFFFFNDIWRIFIMIIGVFHASYRAYQHVNNNN